MRRSEKRWLILGIVLGLVIAAAVGALYERPGGHKPSRQQQTEAVSDTPQQEPESSSAVQLTDQEQQAIGVETVEVKRATIRKEITVPGKVAEPETGIGTISARIGGRIEKLLINATGETVNRGQPVALIYSPEVFAAGEEYRLALENHQRLSESKEQQARSDAGELVRASRRRLEIRGLNAEQID